MSKNKKTAIWIVVACVAATSVTIVVLKHRRKPIVLMGTVLRQDKDPNKQLPIGGAEIIATNNLGVGSTVSDATGFFRISLPKGLRRRQPLILEFHHKDYQPLTLHDYI